MADTPKSQMDLMLERAGELFPCVKWKIDVDSRTSLIHIEGILNGASFGSPDKFHCQCRMNPREAVEMFENEDDEEKGKYRFLGMTVEQIVFLLKGKVPERNIKWTHRDWFDHILRCLIEDLSWTAFAFGRSEGVVRLRIHDREKGDFGIFAIEDRYASKVARGGYTLTTDDSGLCAGYCWDKYDDGDYVLLRRLDAPEEGKTDSENWRPYSMTLDHC